jgi:dolichol-phosphate mannosyltransferase
MPLDASEFCVMSPRAVEALRRLKEANRSQRSLRAWIGFRQAGIDYQRDRRFAGETKFSLLGYFAFAIESIVAFSAVPLRLISLSGMVMALASVVGAAVYLVGKATGAITFPAGLATLYVIVPLFFGITMAAIGVVGEYVGLIYEEVKQRPNFIVAQVLPEATPALGSSHGHDRAEGQQG